MLLRGQLSGFSHTVFPFKVYQVLVRYGEVESAKAAVYVQPLKLGYYWENKFAYHFKGKKKKKASSNLKPSFDCHV